MSTPPKTLLTPEQYLELERKAERKSEYFNGEMFAMSGASLAHIRLDRAPVCNDMRVFVPATGLYTYPDVVVFCGPPQLQDAFMDTLLNPTLIVEVLSPSTEAYDRGRKFEHYRSIQSLAQYVLVASDRVHADLYTRQEDGRWLLSSAGLSEDSLQLQSIDCKLNLADLYERIDFSTAG